MNVKPNLILQWSSRKIHFGGKDDFKGTKKAKKKKKLKKKVSNMIILAKI